MIVSHVAATPPVSPDSTPAPQAPGSRAPSILAVPTVDDAAASASASLAQAASFVGLLESALAESMEAYARVVKRGYLDDAIGYAQYAYALIDYDHNVDNDGFKSMIESGVMEALKGVRADGTAIGSGGIRDDLAMAKAAAQNAAIALSTLAGKPA